ncbi:MAG TPA: DUF3040 domain-containing protein [Geodermatophilus sp.]|nr:DUF3040 domain-containing protein [Geodermatophilus sp.]
MLSDHERRVLDELERSYAADSHEPPEWRGAHGPRSRRDRSRSVVRAAAVVLGSGSALLLVAGAASAALALATATGLGWLLWHSWPHLSEEAMAAWPVAGASRSRSGPDRRPGSDWLSQYLKRLSEAE